MKEKYLKPNMTVFCMENQTILMAGSINIHNEDATVTDGYYDEDDY